MSDAEESLRLMEQAEQRGDHRTARALAKAILGATEAAGPPEDVAARASATELLRRTEPDPFLVVVGALGLGVMVWLVYHYVL